MSVFHPTEIGKKIGDCEIGFENNRYFLSTTISSNLREEAERKGKRRLTQVLSILCLFTGISYQIESFHVDQTSGEKPYLYTSNLVLERITLLPIDNEIVARTDNALNILDKLPNEKPAKIMERAVNYFLRGCYLKTKWRSESFLNFYKVTELIAQVYHKEFNQAFGNKLKNTLFELTETEIQKLTNQTRLIRFMCAQLGVADDNVSRIVRLRATFSAHATMDEPAVSPEDFNNCKILASNSLINYIERNGFEQKD